MVTRNRIKIRGKSVYAKRNKLGQFTDIQNIGRSIRADAAHKAKKKPKKKGQGFEGDYAKPKKKAKKVVHKRAVKKKR